MSETFEQEVRREAELQATARAAGEAHAALLRSLEIEGREARKEYQRAYQRAYRREYTKRLDVRLKRNEYLRRKRAEDKAA